MQALIPEWPQSGSVHSKRPFVWLNAAMSLDGRIAYSQGKRALLSTPGDLVRVDLLRATSDAVLVGAGTVRMDDPSLRVHWERLEGMDLPEEVLHRKTSPPMRVILGSSSGLPPKSEVFDGRIPTVVFSTSLTPIPLHNVSEIHQEGHRVDIPRALHWLRDHGVRRLLVEGGAEVIASFLRWGLVDRFTLFVSPVLVGGKMAPALLGGSECNGEGDALPLTIDSIERSEGGMLLTMTPQRISA